MEHDAAPRTSSIEPESAPASSVEPEALNPAAEPFQPAASSQESQVTKDTDLSAIGASSAAVGAAGATAVLGALSLSDAPAQQASPDQATPETISKSSEPELASPDQATPETISKSSEPELASPLASTSKSYKLSGKGLRLNSREDFAPYAKEIQEIQDLEKIHVGGHTLGVGACQALADVLKEKKGLKVSL